MTYDRLDPAKLIDTIRMLEIRIDERFPGSGLGKVCRELLQIAQQARARSNWIARPNGTSSFRCLKPASTI
jgi:hypothetical protein